MGGGFWDGVWWCDGERRLWGWSKVAPVMVEGGDGERRRLSFPPFLLFLLFFFLAEKQGLSRGCLWWLLWLQLMVEMEVVV